MINVCLSTDNNYSKYAGVVIASILNNANPEDELHFYILDGGIQQENKDKILALKSIKDCQIDFVQVDDSEFEIYKNIKTHSYVTLQTYYRLKLAAILPEVERIIYLDCDMVVNSSLKDLFESNLHNNVIGGSLDARVKHKRKWKNSNYINAGMILFDLRKFREENIEDVFIEYTKSHIDSIDTGDQDIINFALKDRIEILPDKWNVQVSGFASRSSFMKLPNIIHYISADKPWIFGSCIFFKELYFKYLQLTPWALTEEEKQYWYVENKKVSTARFWQKRPHCIFNPKYWLACYCSFVK